MCASQVCFSVFLVYNILKLGTQTSREKGREGQRQGFFFWESKSIHSVVVVREANSRSGNSASHLNGKVTHTHTHTHTKQEYKHEEKTRAHRKRSRNQKQKKKEGNRLCLHRGSRSELRGFFFGCSCLVRESRRQQTSAHATGTQEDHTSHDFCVSFFWVFFLFVCVCLSVSPLCCAFSFVLSARSLRVCARSLSSSVHKVVLVTAPSVHSTSPSSPPPRAEVVSSFEKGSSLVFV